MKKFISVFIVIAMMLQGIVGSAVTVFATDGIEVVSVSADDFTVIEGSNGGVAEEGYYDEAQDEWVVVGTYFRYHDAPAQLTVTYTENGEQKVLTAPDWEIEQTLGLRPEFSSDQNYNNQWTVGNTYECRVSVGGVGTTYRVTVVSSPIERVEVEEVPAIYENSNGRYASASDENGNETKYFVYNVPNPMCTVYFNDGREPLTAYIWDLSPKYGLDCYIGGSQGYDNRWTLGVNRVDFDICGYKSYFNVEIIENPFASLELLSEPAPVIEKAYGFYTTDTLWSPDTGDTFSPEYFRYWDPDDGVEVKLTMKGGTFYTGSPREVSEDAGINYVYYSDQAWDNEWQVGMHSFTLEMAGLTVEVPFEIIESNVKSIKVISETEHIYEGCNGRTDYDRDEYGNEIPGTEWFRYNYINPTVEISFVDGTSDSGNLWELGEKYGYDYIFDDGQSYETPWGVGSHTVFANFMGCDFTFEVVIDESPVKSVYIYDITDYEGIDGYNQTEYVYDEALGESVEVSYFSYYTYPERIRITFNDDTVYDGSVWEIPGENEISVNVNDDQSYDNPWGVGEHTVEAKVAGVVTEYTVTVVPNPITGVSFVKNPLKTSFGTFESIDTAGAVVRISYNDGTYFDLELPRTFDLGYASYHDEKLDRDIFITNEGDYNDAGDKYRIAVNICGFVAECYVDIYEQEATTLTVTNEKGLLYITSDVGGTLKKEQVLHFDLLGAEFFGEDDTYVCYAIYGVITMESGGYSGAVILTIPKDATSESDIAISFILFGIESNSLDSCPWLMSNIYFQVMSNLFASYNYYSFIKPESFDGTLTEDNIDFAASFAATMYASGMIEADIEVDYADYNSVPCIAINAEALETIIREEFIINGSSPIDFSKADFAESFDGAKYYVPVLAAGGDVEIEAPYTFVATEEEGGYAYEITTVMRGADDTKGTEFTIKLSPDLKIEAYNVVRTVVDTFLDRTQDFKNTYEVGEELDTNGLYVVVLYSDMNRVEIPVTPDMVSGFDSSEAGTQTLTVTCGDFTGTLEVTVNELPEYVPGDFNGDGNVTLKDVLLARKAVAGVYTASDDEVTRGDLNGDGDITLKDVLIMRKMVAGVL